MKLSTIATRRAVIVGATVALFAAGSCSPTAEQGTAGPTQLPPQSDPDFLRLSQALTGYADLDPITAARLSAAFAKVAPQHHARFRALLERARPGVSPKDLLALADTAHLAPTALAIVAAWYTGTAGSGVQAITVAYRDALMQGPVADALLPPTYAMGGAAWWTAEPPDVGLSRPVARAPAPATVGNPEPKPQ
jgi:fructose 5-dehydrogenase small subunit